MWKTVMSRVSLIAVAFISATEGAASPKFETEIQPIFEKHCTSCHGPEKQKSGLRLDSRKSALAGGESNKPAIVPMKTGESRLVELISAAPGSDLRMPPKGEMLKPEQVSLIKAWIEAGAEWPEAVKPVGNIRREMVVTDKDREHWAFRPLRVSAKSLQLLRGGDRGVASRRTLIRRVYFDLIGLPPTPAEIEAFEKDTAADAYGRLVDRLLSSRHYGERWGRHWLDLARYADSDGYESDKDRPQSWVYRDWVIRALNGDMPYDQFVKWQLAGDEVTPTVEDAVAATGFLTAGPIADTTPADTEENKLKIRYDELDDMVSTTGSAMLGLTIGCARCHDHKFDPIPTRDYYRMVAAFQNTQRATTYLSKPHREREHWIAARQQELREFKMKELALTEEEKFWLRQPEHFFVPVQVDLYKKYGAKLKSTAQELRKWLPEPQRRIWEQLDAAVAKAETAKPEAGKKTALIAFDEQSAPEPAYLLRRGSVTDRTTPVSFGVLQVLTRGRTAEEYLAKACGGMEVGLKIEDYGFAPPVTTFQRKALAEWLTDVDHGAGRLLARVMVNRLWQHHFGEGFVKTPNDFGTQGTEPSDAALMDGLASELIRGGWRLKPLHKKILMSAAYRARDRRPVRLEAEALRDSILAVSGRLNRKMFGPPFRPIIPKEAIATRSKDEYPVNLQDGVERWRRSVYAFTKRSVPNPFMEVFDSPDATTACGRRNVTTVPTQALTLMNDEFVRQCAIQFAQRVFTEAGTEPKAQIMRAYQLALGRLPVEAELGRALGFVGKAGDARGEGIPVEGLTDFCHMLFTLNEFIYVD